MKIHGLQKMTLLDYPGHVACTVFLGQCDFRCPYCHNYELVDSSAPACMDSDELFAFLKKRQGLLDGVAITGGEPCLHKGLYDLIANHPALLSKLLDGHLVDYVAMDIKNSPSKYAMTVGLERIDPEPIRHSIDLLMQGTTEYEFRTTVVKELHEAQDFEEIGQMIAGASKYYLQKFTDRDTVPYGNLHAHSKESMQMFAEIVSKYVDYVSLRGVD